MEDYRLLGTVDGKYQCIHKKFNGQYELDFRNRGKGDLGLCGDIRRTAGGSKELELVSFPIPDINDAALFEGVDLPPWEDLDGKEECMYS